MKETAKSLEFLAKPGIHEEWESDYLNPALNRFYDAAFARIVEGLGAFKGDEILDAGCGYGFHAARLARCGLKVTGVDFSASALAAARQNLSRENLNIEVREGNLLALPFPDASFQFVSCWGVLMHIPELEQALDELARVLKPGGRLALMENNRDSLHVRVLEPAIRGAKRILGRDVPQRSNRNQGVEEWREEGLMVRKLDCDWLIAYFKERGVELVDRFSGQFTEFYTLLPMHFLKRLVYWFNGLWFRLNLPSRYALGNILIFEKAEEV